MWLNIPRLVAALAFRQSYIWLPGYLSTRRSRTAATFPPHLMFCVVDHFEPARSSGRVQAAESVSQWCARSEALRSAFKDSYGRMPQHTWFYRADYTNDDCLRALSDSAYGGFGEVEFHLHHGYDTPSGFGAKIDDGLEWFNSFGAMLGAQSQPRRRFGYIAGDWALDNGRGDPRYSGVDTEIHLLKMFGCYGDFTFPAYGTNAQPRKVNAVYYATEDGRAKSYSTGIDTQKGLTGSGDLMMIQGPLYIDWQHGYLETAAIEDGNPFTPRRLRYWLSANVHVAGRPDCVIIKLHTHGMQSRETILGAPMQRLFAQLETCCAANGTRLHYVTARELFNFVRAVEDGFDGDPNDVLDFEVARPVNRRVRSSSRYRCLRMDAQGATLQFPSRGPVSLEFADGPLRSVCAEDLERIDVRSGPGERSVSVTGTQNCELTWTSREGAPASRKLALPATVELS
jgi:hypothetical protein